MKTPFQLGCRCGKVKGRLLSNSGLHLRCWCGCCAKFAKWMESRDVGSTKNYMNKTHGTEAFQFFRDEVLLDAGHEFVVGTKLTRKTATVRYISTCCDTPLFATPDRPSFVPLISVSASFIVNEDSTPPFNGPVEFEVFAAEAAKETQNGTMVRNGIHYKFVLRTVARILKGVLFQKHKPNPADQVEVGRTIIIADE